MIKFKKIIKITSLTSFRFRFKKKISILLHNSQSMESSDFLFSFHQNIRFHPKHTDFISTKKTLHTIELLDLSHFEGVKSSYRNCLWAEEKKNQNWLKCLLFLFDKANLMAKEILISMFCSFLFETTVQKVHQKLSEWNEANNGKKVENISLIFLVNLLSIISLSFFFMIACFGKCCALHHCRWHFFWKNF